MFKAQGAGASAGEGVGVAIEVKDSLICLSGQVDRYTVPELIRGVDISVFGHEHITVDFSAVTQVDTAGLAWVLKLLGKARQLGVTVALQALPQQLINLASISDVDQLLQK
ncbi:MAG: phospholipid transport system transporter-binding protein [Phenylobacterium sp.]